MEAVEPDCSKGHLSLPSCNLSLPTNRLPLLTNELYLALSSELQHRTIGQPSCAPKLHCPPAHRQPHSRNVRHTTRVERHSARIFQGWHTIHKQVHKTYVEPLRTVIGGIENALRSTSAKSNSQVA